MEFCVERGLGVSSTYFKLRSLNRYKRVARGQAGVAVKCMIDLVLVKKNMLRYGQGVRAVRGIGLGFSYHHVVLRKVRLAGAWIKKREV